MKGELSKTASGLQFPYAEEREKEVTLLGSLSPS